MNAISQQRFDALAGYSRRPSPFPYEERDWYELRSERILGVIVQDGTDNDFAGLALAKDRNTRYRAVDITQFFDAIEDARTALSILMEKQASESDDPFEQGDEVRLTTALLKPAVPQERMARLFRVLIESEAYSAAKGLIEALSPYFRDLDGNFIEQFQTTAFDARIFELYMFAMLHEVGYAFDETEAAPDYHCIAFGVDFFVEAVTVQPTAGLDVPEPEQLLKEVATPEKVEFFSIKFGSALVSKLRKRYWERKHVTNHPFVLAIQNFSEPLAMVASSTSLANYLYGWRHTATRDAAGRLLVTWSRIGEHRRKGKSVPSDFFGLPEASNISAVIFNPHATLPKFNRMGVLAGFGSDRIQLIRRGMLVNHDPDASEGIPFSADVRDPNYRENWSEGLNVYHNPLARFPLEPRWFPNAAHHFLRRDGGVVSYSPERFPLASVTVTVGFGGKS